MRKLLLLTNVPPCNTDAGGLTLAKLCRFLPRGSLACFTVCNSYWRERAPIASDLDWIPVHYESPLALHRGALGELLALPLEGYGWSRALKLVDKAVSFGRDFGADAVWCHMAGQTIMRIALWTARGLGVPLLTQVLDPPNVWFRYESVPKYTRMMLAEQFDSTLRASMTCAAICEAMAEEYRRSYGVSTIVVPPGLEPRLAVPPNPRASFRKDLVIAVSGNLVAQWAWYALIAALQSVDWKICGRDVRIRVTARNLPIDAAGRVAIEFLGWLPTQEDSIRLLSEADILYCPYWFEPDCEPEARFSFPSKLPPYFAAGRPVLFHGPPHSSAAPFLRDNDAGLCCFSLEPQDIVEALSRLASDDELYARLVKNGRAAFERHLTTDVMRTRFAEFLGVGVRALLPADTGSMPAWEGWAARS